MARESKRGEWLVTNSTLLQLVTHEIVGQAALADDIWGHAQKTEEALVGTVDLARAAPHTCRCRDRVTEQLPLPHIGEELHLGLNKLVVRVPREPVVQDGLEPLCRCPDARLEVDVAAVGRIRLEAGITERVVAACQLYEDQLVNSQRLLHLYGATGSLTTTRRARRLWAVIPPGIRRRDSDRAITLHSITGRRGIGGRCGGR